MKTAYTKDEILEKCRREAEDYSKVMVVDPIRFRVTDASEPELPGRTCYSAFKRGGRCEDCTSMRALFSHGKAAKTEVVGGKIFLVESRYITVDGKDQVLETIDDITE